MDEEAVLAAVYNDAGLRRCGEQTDAANTR